MIAIPIILISLYIKLVFIPFGFVRSAKLFNINNSKKYHLLCGVLAIASFGILFSLYYWYLIKLRIKFGEASDYGKKEKYYFNKEEDKKTKEKR